MTDKKSSFLAPERFPEKLGALRRRRRLSLQTLAHALGYASHAHLANIESGRRKATKRLVLSVAQYFNVKSELLLRDDLELDSPVPDAPRTEASTPARGRSKKLEIGLDEALHAQIHQYAEKHEISLSALVRTWLRRQTDPKAQSPLPFGVARELDVVVTKKLEVRVEPELLDQAQRHARRHLVALAPLVRAWLRAHTNPRSPAPVPAGIGEERKRPSRGKKRG